MKQIKVTNEHRELAQALINTFRPRMDLYAERFDDDDHVARVNDWMAKKGLQRGFRVGDWKPAGAKGQRKPLTLNVVAVTSASLKDDMASGRIDLALGLLPQLQAGFFQQSLFRQPYVCLMREGHPLASTKALTLPDFAAASHVRVIAAGTGHGRVDEALERQGLQRRIRLTVPHYVALGDVLGHSDLMATVPERFAQRVTGPFALTTRALPLAVDGSAIHQFWHARLHKDPGHQWLRGQVAQLFGDGSKPAAEQTV